MSTATWLLFLDTTPLDEFFRGIYIPFDSEFLVVQPANDDAAVLTEVYRISASLPLQTHPFGTWSPGDGLTCSDVSFYQRRDNLQGLVLRTAFVKVSAFAYSCTQL
jgi:hypothetical protein